jgi:hypothetical protein
MFLNTNITETQDSVCFSLIIVSNSLFTNYFNVSQTKGSFRHVEERKDNLMLQEGEISLK